MADLAGRHQRTSAATEAAVLEVLRSGRYVGGPTVEEAQRRLAASFGWGYGVGVNSGTDALIYALLALDLPPGSEVIVPAVTFFATAGAVLRAGLVPVVADVRADLPLLDARRLPLRAATRAVIAVHLYGEKCPLRDVGLPVVDDSAQCAGADPQPRTGEIAAVSFYPTKTLGAAGDGGMVFTDQAEVAERLRRLSHHGMSTPYLHDRVGGQVGANSRLDALQAALLLAQLPDLPLRVQARRRHAQVYDQELPSWVRRLPRSPGHPVHQYVVRVPGRDRLREKLAEAGIETAIYYPIPLSRQPALAGLPHAETPCADAFCAESLALPVHEGLTGQEIEKIVATFRSYSP